MTHGAQVNQVCKYFVNPPQGGTELDKSEFVLYKLGKDKETEMNFY